MKILSRIALCVFFLFAPIRAQAHGVTLRWAANAPPDNVTAYKVYVATGTCSPAPGDWVLIATIGPNSTSFVDQPSKQGIYDYCVTAVNANGESGRSVDVCVLDTMSGRETAQWGAW